MVKTALRKASAARLTTELLLALSHLLPLVLVPGHNSSQEAKCLADFQQLRSVQISELIFSALLVSMPWMWVRSTPLIRSNPCSSWLAER